jgi:phage regulator Rha-like protein
MSELPASMEHLLCVVDNEVTVTSLVVAEHFDCPHKSLMQTIASLSYEMAPELWQIAFAECPWSAEAGLTLAVPAHYRMNRCGFDFVMMVLPSEFSPERYLAFTDAFDSLAQNLLPSSPSKSEHSAVDPEAALIASVLHPSDSSLVAAVVSFSLGNAPTTPLDSVLSATYGSDWAKPSGIRGSNSETLVAERLAALVNGAFEGQDLDAVNATLIAKLKAKTGFDATGLSVEELMRHVMATVSAPEGSKVH